MDPFERWLSIERFTGLSAEQVKAGAGMLAGIRTWLLSAVAPRAGDTVLEIGCGAGEFLPQLLEAVGPTGSVVALDLSAGLCAQAMAALGAHPLGHRGRVLQGDMRRLPLANASIQAVVCRSVLQYAENDLDGVAAEMARVLVPQGKLAVFEMLSADGTPLLPVPRGQAQRRAHARAIARWRDLPWGLSRQALAAAFQPPLFCPVTISATTMDWHGAYTREAFLPTLDQVPRPGTPTLATLFTADLTPEERADWDLLLNEARFTAQRGAWAYLSAQRAGHA